MHGIVHDVFPDCVKTLLAADDVFIIIALPDQSAGRVAHLVNTFGGGGFE